MIRTKSMRLNRIIMHCGMALLPLTGLGLSGCIIIPTPSHGGVGVITKETVESFEPGKTTRADVLLRLGDPAKRLEEDRIFVYQWERIHAYVISMLPQTNYDLPRPHYLGLEFASDNRVRRVRVLDASFTFFDQYPKLEEWMAEKSESSHP